MLERLFEPGSGLLDNILAFVGWLELVGGIFLTARLASIIVWRARVGFGIPMIRWWNHPSWFIVYAIAVGLIAITSMAVHNGMGGNEIQVVTFQFACLVACLRSISEPPQKSGEGVWAWLKRFLWELPTGLKAVDADDDYHDWMKGLRWLILFGALLLAHTVFTDGVSSITRLIWIGENLSVMIFTVPVYWYLNAWRKRSKQQVIAAWIVCWIVALAGITLAIMEFQVK